MKFTKFGLILVGIYALIIIAILGYSEFICKPNALSKFEGADENDAFMACLIFEIAPVLPWLPLLFTWVTVLHIFPDSTYSSYGLYIFLSIYITSFLINLTLIYFFGSVIEKILKIFVDLITRKR